MKQYQQGDCVLKQTVIPTGERKYKPELILAYGESTGHAHRIVFDGNTVSLQKLEPAPIKMFTVGGKTYIEAPIPFTVTHEEHKHILVPAGDYELHIVREFDYDTNEARNVAD